jgi:hypothetical protein
MLDKFFISPQPLVSWSITRSTNFQGEKISIQFTLPEGMDLQDGYLLARGICNIQAGLDVEKKAKTADLYKRTFGGDINNLERNGVEEWCWDVDTGK